MVFRQARAVFRKAKDFAGQAYATAHDLAPGIRKGADAIKRGYAAASDSGLIDQVGGKRAGEIHRGARRALATYDKFEDVARKTDGVVRAMR